MVTPFRYYEEPDTTTAPEPDRDDADRDHYLDTLKDDH